MKICILIPAHNEANNIGKLLEELRARRLPVVVVDDGSIDATGKIAQEKGAVALRNEPKRGKGGSLQRGFEYVLTQDFDAVMAMDGDGQHAVSDLDRFFEKAEKHSPCVVNGSRMENTKGMPFVRLCTNRFMSFIISAVCKQRIPDTQCGYRLISCEVLRQIKLTSSDFEIETEVLIKASKKGFPIYSVPIKTIYGNELSKIRPMRDTVRFFAYLFRELWFSKNK